MWSPGLEGIRERVEDKRGHEENEDDWAMHDRKDLLALVDELAAALLDAEWRNDGACIDCGRWPPLAGGGEIPGSFRGHATDCDVDSLLTKCGYPDQPSRDAARERLRNGK